MNNSLDMRNVRDEEFEEMCVYVVHDRPCGEDCPNRARATLPRNLTVKGSAIYPGVIDMSKKYFSMTSTNYDIFTF